MNKGKTKKKIKLVPVAAAAAAVVAAPTAICAVESNKKVTVEHSTEDIKKSKTAKSTSTKQKSTGVSKNVKIWRKDQDGKVLSSNSNNLGSLRSSDKNTQVLGNEVYFTGEELRKLGDIECWVTFFTNMTCQISGYRINHGDDILRIPATQDYQGQTYKLVKIGNDAFKDWHHWLLPDWGIDGIDFSQATNLVEIGKNAFSGGILNADDFAYKTLDLSHTKIHTIGENAFNDAFVTNHRTFNHIVLPNTIRSIGDNAFGNKVWAKNVSIPVNDPNQIQNLKFGNNWLPNSENKHSRLFLPYGTTNLYKEANINLGNWTIAEGERHMLGDVYVLVAFHNDENKKWCEITNVVGTSKDDILRLPATIKSLTNNQEYPLTKIHDHAFAKSQTVDAIDFSQATNLEEIGEGAFYKNALNKSDFTNKTLDLSKTKVHTIGKEAFFDGFTHDLSAHVLDEIIFPATLKNIGYGAFYRITSKKITFLNSNKDEIVNMTIDGNWAPDRDSKSNRVYVPSGTKDAYKQIKDVDWKGWEIA